MLAFAANSVIGRLALTNDPTEFFLIDPANYTLIRLISGACMLGFITFLRHGISKSAFSGSNIYSALFLFIYAAAFSFSYISIDTGVGALILFASVQLSMFAWAVFKKQQPGIWEFGGSAIALFALFWFVSPGLSAPDPIASALMACSGIAWAAYTIMGKQVINPLAATAGNFVIAAPIALALVVFHQSHLTMNGVVLAILSGAITSGIGYAVWYGVLPHLSTSRAAISQLSVPVLAGIGGSLFVSESWSQRFTIASILILGGIAIGIFGKHSKN